MGLMIPFKYRLRMQRSGPVDAEGWPGVGLMLDQRQGRWARIETTLGDRPMSAVCFPCKHDSLKQCRFNVGPTSKTAGQH